MRKMILYSFLGMWLITGGFVAYGQEAPKMGAMPAQPSHIIVSPGDIVWVDAPPSLPKGAKMVVLEGNPTEAGPFTLRFQIPANYSIPAHWHPADEHVTVLAGTFNMGAGDKLDPKASKVLSVGSFVVMPAKMHHFAWTKEGATVQLHGIGPWGITYINPADDPRTKQQ